MNDPVIFTGCICLFLSVVFALAAWFERREERKLRRSVDRFETDWFENASDFFQSNGRTRTAVVLARQKNDAAGVRTPASRTKETPLVTRQ